MDWQMMTANEAEALAAGMYAGERAAKRATMKPARGGFDKPSGLASIDWHNVKPLEDDERWDNEPGHPGSPAPIAKPAACPIFYSPTLATFDNGWEY